MTRRAVDLGKAAAAFAATGIPVFPIVPGQKRPLTEHGLHDATTDLDQVRRWWTRTPTANIGMPTGTFTWDVLDIDTKHDQPGLDSLRTLATAGLVEGWSRIVATPTGGLHLYFAGTDQRNSTIPGVGVDFRSSGGYVLLPPSTVTVDGQAQTYRVLRTSRQAEPVDWPAIRERLKPTPPSTHPSPTHLVDPDQHMVALTRHVERAAEGNRNHALYWAAHRAIDNGSSDLAPLVDAAMRAGLGRREAERTVTSARRRRTAPTPRPTEHVVPGDSPTHSVPFKGAPSIVEY